MQKNTILSLLSFPCKLSPMRKILLLCSMQLLAWQHIGIANLPGVISLVAGLFMWVTSLPPVRRLNFELFFYTHQLYVVFVVFLALHVGDFIFSIAAAGIFLFMLDRFLRFFQSRRTVEVLSATCLPCGTMELVLSKPGSNDTSSCIIRLFERDPAPLDSRLINLDHSLKLDGLDFDRLCLPWLGSFRQKLHVKI